MEEDTTHGRLEPPGPFIRHKLPGLPDTMQSTWRSPPLPGPKLMVGSELPAETVRVLMGANILRRVGKKPEYWAEVREGVEATARLTAPDWPVEDGYTVLPSGPFWSLEIERNPSEDRQAFERVADCLEVMEAAARWAKRAINEAGFDFKWEDGVLKAGRKQALRVSVEALLANRDDLDDLSPDDYSLRKKLAKELGPFFPQSRLDAEDPHGVLKNTIRNALEELRGSDGDSGNPV